MTGQTKTFQTAGPVILSENYFVERREETAEFLSRIERGKYIVIFAPRQTGKTSFFRQSLDKLTEDASYIPIALDFEVYSDVTSERFYQDVQRILSRHLISRLKTLSIENFSETKTFIKNYVINDHLSFEDFFFELSLRLPDKKVVIIIDEFDGIPQVELRNFLHTLRRIYHNVGKKSIHSVGIVGVKSVSQLDYDRSVSPFNIQDEFELRNFTLQQVRELIGQYTDEVGQVFAPEVIQLIHSKTAGQPFLVNRLAQILTEELQFSKTETITCECFQEALQLLLKEDNTHFDTLVKNIRQRPEFKNLLLKIISREEGVLFNRRDDVHRELTTYGVIKEDNGMCVIENPIYQSIVIDAFKPGENGLEGRYLPEDTSFAECVTPDGIIQMESLLKNFCDFIQRIGFRILEIPQTPHEFVGQYLLIGYLDMFVRQIGADIYPEVPTGRGRMDIILLFSGRKYIIETKLFYGEKQYQTGKRQLAEYLKSEQVGEGYYVVFDYRSQKAQGRMEKEKIDTKTIFSYCIPVLQRRPSNEG